MNAPKLHSPILPQSPSEKEFNRKQKEAVQRRELEHEKWEKDLRKQRIAAIPSADRRILDDSKIVKLWVEHTALDEVAGSGYIHGNKRGGVRRRSWSNFKKMRRLLEPKGIDWFKYYEQKPGRSFAALNEYMFAKHKNQVLKRISELGYCRPEQTSMGWE